MKSSNIYPVVRFHFKTLNKQTINVTEKTCKLIKLDCVVNPNCSIKSGFGCVKGVYSLNGG